MTPGYALGLSGDMFWHTEIRLAGHTCQATKPNSLPASLGAALCEYCVGMPLARNLAPTRRSPYALPLQGGGKLTIAEGHNICAR